MSWSLALALPGLLVLAAVLYLGFYFAWEARQTRGLSYFGRMPVDRRAIKARIALFSSPAVPLVRALASLRRKPRTMPRFYFQGVAGPPTVSSADQFERATRYAPRSGDVFVATQMRSGTTWMQQLVHQIATRGEGELGSADAPHLYAMSPWLETSDTVPVEDAPAVGEPALRIIKTHLPARLCPYAPHARYVYVARNPVTCFASIVDFNRSLLGPLLPPEAVLADWFCSDDMYWSPWPVHVTDWWQWSLTRDNVLFVHFEDMSRSFATVRNRVAQFLGVVLTPQQARRVDEKCSFDYMSAHEEVFEMARPTMFSVRRGRFLRSGKESRAERLSPAIRAQIVDYCRRSLAGSSYPAASHYPELALDAKTTAAPCT